MFKKFVRELTEAETEEEILSIFYRADGIDMSYQYEKITWKDHELLLDLVNKLSGLMEKAGKVES